MVSAKWKIVLPLVFLKCKESLPREKKSLSDIGAVLVGVVSGFSSPSLFRFTDQKALSMLRKLLHSLAIVFLGKPTWNFSTNDIISVKLRMPFTFFIGLTPWISPRFMRLSSSSCSFSYCKNPNTPYSCKRVALHHLRNNKAVPSFESEDGRSKYLPNDCEEAVAPSLISLK